MHSLSSAITVRAAHGLVGAALGSLGLYYVIQAFPTKYRLKAVVTGLGLTQLALPLARVFSTDLLEFGEWQGLYLFECGLAVFALACVLALKLPPSDRYRVFEPLDFFTFSLFAAGSAGLAAVLSLGRLLWWTSAPWLGVVLAASIVLLCAATWIEHNRRNLMINTRWLASADLLRLGLAILLIRLVLSEQSTGAIGFFQTLGLANTQLQTLFALMLLGAVVGVAASAWLINPARVAEHLIIAVAAICIGCLMDASATSLTRPEQMYVSQFLLAFGSTFFIGPAMVAGIGRVIAQPGNLISFIVLFGMAQNMGGLLGSALLGIVQVVREKYHSSQLVEHLVLTDPQVAARVQAYASLYGRSIDDPAQRQAQGMRALSSVATREANVLAYNDVFLLIGCISIATGLWILSVLVWQRYLRPSLSVAPSSCFHCAPMNTPADTTAIAEQQRRRIGGVIGFGGLALLGVALVLYAWRLPPFVSAIEHTENAMVNGQITVIAPQVSGYVTQVPVQDFAHVKPGQLLAKIDDRIYAQQLEQAKAQVQTAQANLANWEQQRHSADATIAEQRAALSSNQAQRDRTRSAYARTQQLASQQLVSEQDRDTAFAAHAQADASVAQARAAVQAAEENARSVTVNRAALQAAVANAQAAVRLAQINLDNTRIFAPRDGQLGQLSVRQGAYVTNGTQLMSLVPDTLWIVANFKETQMPRIRVGQRASFSVDALDNARLHGRVQ